MHFPEADNFCILLTYPHTNLLVQVLNENVGLLQSSFKNKSRVQMFILARTLDQLYPSQDTCK